MTYIKTGSTEGTVGGEISLKPCLIAYFLFICVIIYHNSVQNFIIHSLASNIHKGINNDASYSVAILRRNIRNIRKLINGL